MLKQVYDAYGLCALRHAELLRWLQDGGAR